MNTVPRIVLPVGLDMRRFLVERERHMFTVVAEDRGPKQAFGVTVTSSPAIWFGVAPAGVVATVRVVEVVGVAAGLTAHAPAGAVSVNEEIAGQTAAMSMVAHPGTITTVRHVRVEGDPAGGSAFATPGWVVAEQNCAVTGVVVSAVWSAPAGNVTSVRNVVVAGAPSALAGGAPAGSVSTERVVTVAGDAASWFGQAFGGQASNIVSATVLGATSTSSSAAPAGVVLAVKTATVTSPTATSTAAALSGVISAVRNVNVAGVVAASAAVAPAGIIFAVKNATITGVSAVSTGVAPAGTITAVQNVIYRNDFTGSTFDSGWVADPTYGGWTLTGTGLAQPSQSYAKHARLLPTPKTSVTAEVAFTVLPNSGDSGSGVYIATSNALSYAAGWWIYTGLATWTVWHNDSQVASGSRSLTAPVSTLLSITGGQLTAIVNGNQVYTAATSETVYGFGMAENTHNAGTRADWIEAR